MMYTRKQYMDREVTHRKYYGQFVFNSVKQLVLREFSIEELREALRTDVSMNNLSLERWDLLAPYIQNLCGDELKASEDFYSLATGVCIMKEAARQIVEAQP